MPAIDRSLSDCRYVSSRAVKHMANSVMGPAFARWCDFVHEHARQERVVRNAAVRLASAQLFFAMDAWVQFIEATKAQHETVERTILMFSNSLAGSALSQWKVCEFALRMMDFAFKMMKFAFEMMDSVFKMMNSGRTGIERCVTSTRLWARQ